MMALDVAPACCWTADVWPTAWSGQRSYAGLSAERLALSNFFELEGRVIDVEVYDSSGRYDVRYV